MTGAVALMEALRAEGVEYIFGNPGTSEGPILDALENYPDLKYILATQESVAMGMGDAYARASGKTAFVSLHIDSGLANGISLLTNAYEFGTPLVLTSANKDVRKLNEGRSDLAGMVSQFTKWSVEVSHPDQVPGAIRRAFNEARTPPTGPVYVSFAANALDEETETEIVPSSRGYFQTHPDARAVEEASNILAEASNPAIIVGNRVAQFGGLDEAVRLAELTGAKVYAASYGHVNFPSSHPQYMGMVNPTVPAGRKALAEHDAVVAVGTSAFAGLFYFEGRCLTPDAKLIHIDSNGREIGKSEPTEVGMLASPKMAMADLADDLERRMSGSAREAAKGRCTSIAEEKAAQKNAWNQRVKARWDNSPMSTERMMTEVAGAIPENTVIIDDSITTKPALLGALEFDDPDGLVGIVGGSLGWGMGGALGAKLAHPDRPVVAVVGDGTSMMSIQALWTAANSNIPVVYVICNNQSYRILKLNMDTYKMQQHRELEEKSYPFMMDFPLRMNIAGIAEAIGVYAQKIEDPAEIGPAIKKAIASNKPALLDIYIDGAVEH
jgi:benzoylformate decarboxylase